MTKPLIGPKLEGYTIGSWCPTPDGTGQPTAVALSLQIQGFGDIVLRLKSPERVDKMVQQLLQYKQEVWPQPFHDGQHRHGLRNQN